MGGFTLFTPVPRYLSLCLLIILVIVKFLPNKRFNFEEKNKTDVNFSLR